LLPARTGSARFLHPGLAAESVERPRVAPDLTEGMFTRVQKCKTGNDFPSMARKHLAGRRTVDRAAAPAADTGLRKPGEIVGHDRIDDDTAIKARADKVYPDHGFVARRARRHQHCAVLHRPAVILNVRDLDAARAQRQSQLHPPLACPPNWAVAGS